MSEQPTPSQYLEYLPAFFSRPQPGDEGLFLGQYLKVFEKLLSGISDGAAGEPLLMKRKGIRELLDAQTIGSLFYPRLSFLFLGDPTALQKFIPRLSIENGEPAKTDDVQRLQTLGAYVGVEEDADNANIKKWLQDFLVWSGRTIALNVDKNWSIDQTRFVIAQALPFYRARGTASGMTWLLNTWFGLDKDSPVPPSSSGLDLLSISVEDPSFPPLCVRDSDEDRKNAFHLEDSYVEGMPVVCDNVGFEGGGGEDLHGYVSWLFRVNIALRIPPQESLLLLATNEQRADMLSFRDAVANVTDEFKPALTRYEIKTVQALWLGGGWPSANSRSDNQPQGLDMSDNQFPDCRTRLQYVPGMPLTAQDMTTEQSHLLGKLALMNRALYAPGVIGGSSGLVVTVQEADSTWIDVSAGHAIDPDGRVLEFDGTQRKGSVKVKLDPLPPELEVESCYVYLSYVCRPNGEFRVVDDVQLTFSRTRQLKGVLLAKLMLEGESVVEVLSDSENRDYAASRLQPVSGDGGHSVEVSNRLSRAGNMSAWG
jgi:hypothetical protein